jgi:hypothetical protein
MESNSYIISPDNCYRQELRIVLTEEEIKALHGFLKHVTLDYRDVPKVAEDLRAELWYMLIEVREFNAYLKEGGKP